MSTDRLFRFSRPKFLENAQMRTFGVYTAGALFSLGFYFFIDACTYSASHLNGSDVHMNFVDWIPGICSAFGMLVINLIDKTRLGADSFSHFGDGVAWKARVVLFLGFALLAGGLAGSVVVLVLRYLVPEHGFPILWYIDPALHSSLSARTAADNARFGVANVIANALIMLSSAVLWVSQNMEEDYSYNLTL